VRRTFDTEAIICFLRVADFHGLDPLSTRDE